MYYSIYIILYTLPHQGFCMVAEIWMSQSRSDEMQHNIDIIKDVSLMAASIDQLPSLIIQRVVSGSIVNSNIYIYIY